MTRRHLSPAQPEPNTRLVTTALLAGRQLFRAALTRVTSLPTGEMKVGTSG